VVLVERTGDASVTEHGLRAAVKNWWRGDEIMDILYMYNKRTVMVIDFEETCRVG
jgi:hypothetical protein